MKFGTPNKMSLNQKLNVIRSIYPKIMKQLSLLTLMPNLYLETRKPHNGSSMTSETCSKIIAKQKMPSYRN